MSPDAQRAQELMSVLGLPAVKIHHPQNHFDFTKGGRRILVIGPMGSGKTEFSSRVWRDSRIALQKSTSLARLTTSYGADRRQVMFIRSSLDASRFPDYPDDALAFRGGYERLGTHIQRISNSFDLEKLLKQYPQIGTWIIDEAGFYDERLAYLVQRESIARDLVFVFPTLILNFRRDMFNQTARLIVDTASDIIPLTAYCEHPDCIADSLLTYRYYLVDNKECPALFFDPLLIIGGDQIKHDPREPNYATRCERHHYLPGKEYTYLVLKPLGQEAGRGNDAPLRAELKAMKHDVTSSLLAAEFKEKYSHDTVHHTAALRALAVPCIAEKALLYVYLEQNLISREAFTGLVQELQLDRAYLDARLADAGRMVGL